MIMLKQEGPEFRSLFCFDPERDFRTLAEMVPSLRYRRSAVLLHCFMITVLLVAGMLMHSAPCGSVRAAEVTTAATHHGPADPNSETGHECLACTMAMWQEETTPVHSDITEEHSAVLGQPSDLFLPQFLSCSSVSRRGPPLV